MKATPKKKLARASLPAPQRMKIQLPDEKKPVEQDFNRYSFLVYGREKIGKSTLLSQFPDILFISTEPGTKGLEVYEVAVSDWKDIQDTVEALEKTDRFRSVVFDTVDRAYDFCLDYICKKMRIEYPGESADGERDWGRSWRAIRQEFMELVHRIHRTGRGVHYISHVQETEIKSRSGDRWDRIFPSMSKQARGVVEALVDFFFFADYLRDTTGRTIRVLITQGDETVWAGARKGVGNFPPIIPLMEKGGFAILEKGFKGQLKGMDPSGLRSARLSQKATSGLVRKLASGKKSEE